MKREHNFASDNNSGACPEVLEVMEECNREHVDMGMMNGQGGHQMHCGKFSERL